MSEKLNKFADWKEKGVRVIVYYLDASGTARHVIGKITSFDDQFIFIEDQKYSNECCLAISSINKIEIYKSDYKEVNEK